MTVNSLIGQTLGGYRIDERLGAGGMGAVYKATQVRLGRPVALKVLSAELSDDPEFVNRFIQEGEAIASLEHPNIVPIYEADEVQLPNGARCLFLAMRYVGGGSLRDFLQRRGALTPRQARYLLQQAASGLDEAHRRGIIHRDIKPANLLLEPGAPGDAGPRLYLADFGIAKRNDRNDDVRTRTGSFIGTPEYMAPEQLQGGSASVQSDVYALTVVLYEMLTGKSPYSGTTPAMVIYRKLSEPVPPFEADSRGLPSAIDAVLARGMAQDAAQRFASAGELSTAFAAALRNEMPTNAQPLPIAEQPTVVSPRPVERPTPRPAPPIERAPRRPEHEDYRYVPREEDARYAPRLDSNAPTYIGTDERRRRQTAPRRYGIGGVIWILVALLLFAVVGGFLLARTLLRDSAGIGANPGRIPTAITVPGAATLLPTVAPAEPTVAPAEPTVAPEVPTPAPAEPTVAPEAPTLAPAEPTATIEAPSVTPVDVTVTTAPAPERAFPQADIDQAIASTGGTVGLIIYDDAQGGVLYSSNADQVFPAASLIKLPIVLAAYNLGQTGQVDLDKRLTLQDSDKVGGSGRLQGEASGNTYSIRELCSYMLRYSDNTAGNMILRELGGFDQVNAIMQQLGATNTSVKRFFLDQEAQAQGVENLTTASDMLLLLRKLQSGELANPADTRAILAAMGQNDDASKLPAQLPPDVAVAHKSGTLPADSPTGSVEHDVGIIELPAGKSYIIVAMSAGISSNQAGIDAIASISKLVYDYEQ